MDKQTFDLNVSLSDCLSRLLVGISLIAVTLFIDVAPTWLALLGAYPILTAIIGWDPMYALIEGIHQKLPAMAKSKPKFVLSN